ncbi:class I SAM-dependent methyltransferase [Clostridium amazonitimonense]|uniref:class I SAM-dependent methyltransferase n=1 Tax=Clostridium amazonitimonense TaxID=1499689 RepID=UPI00050995B7|nr:rRNA adenine N-6-methyltransferase family protein [Clostridium amazonitimonense]
MEGVTFLKQYILNWRTVGAIFPSSKKLACKMVDNIDFENAKCIIEYGPGTGVFTEELIRRKYSSTKLFIIEYNYEFYNMLKEKYSKVENLYIINDSAENIEEYLKKEGIENVDYIVSGLPFASLKKEMSESILNKSKDILKVHGKFITFQYTLFKRNFINRFFNNINIDKVMINMPSAYVFICEN